jgi:hypothetical protein
MPAVFYRCGCVLCRRPNRVGLVTLLCRIVNPKRQNSFFLHVCLDCFEKRDLIAAIWERVHRC